MGPNFNLPPALDEIYPSPFGGTTGLFYRGGLVNYELWGPVGKGSLVGYSPPNGESWRVRGAGIITDDGRPLEWMLQLYIPWEGHIPNPQLLVPVARNVGLTAGTPVLALGRELVLLPGEAVAARCNGISPDKRLGIRFSAWVQKESWARSFTRTPPTEPPSEGFEQGQGE